MILEHTLIGVLFVMSAMSWVRSNPAPGKLSPKSIPSTTRKKDPQVSYQYPVYGPQLIKNRSTEYVPGIGEVIVAQDRFESRPLFAYKNKNQEAGYSYNVPSGPTLSLKTTTSAPDVTPSRNSYDSPYSSYNPPEFKPYDTFDPSSVSKDNPKSKDKAKPQNDESYPSLGPPLAVINDDKKVDNSYGNLPYDENEQDYEHVPQNHEQHDKPSHPPADIDATYYSSGYSKGPPDPPMSGENDPVDTMMVQQDDLHGKMPFETPEHTAVRAPASPHYDDPHSFPSYLFDHQHYDNHVYEEIPHTTEAAKEDKRVSSTNYSYYYLGRKLWYIPLYFSIYFIIYVTVLILKSIARHKVRLKYKWYEHDTSAKQARSMDLTFKGDESLLSNLHNNVSIALEKTTSKYDKFVPK
ncbi:uncharacterized protein LOC126748467 [Anthonomus grandis grandis]|uniref:uncharacterized protein LOC126748467 n=1 Tax=Anthonomus grandis grandis TaxID=2921223 RepID=UPI0021656FD7|nr:uncharacterized protein LOC126748467 [Anthonomus grandis grandis]